MSLINTLRKFKLTRRKYAVLVFGLALIPAIIPLGLPLVIDYKTKDAMRAIESLNDGDTVGIVFGGSYNWITDRWKWKAIIFSIWDEGANIIIFNIVEPGASQGFQMWYEFYKSEINTRYPGFTYGEDFVIMPFFPGEEDALAAIGADMHVMKVDQFGNDIQDLPLVMSLNTAADLDLVCYNYHFHTFPHQFVRQWPAKYGVPAIDTRVYSSSASYYGTYVVGCFDGNRGAAEVEAYTGFGGPDMMILEVTSMFGLATLTLIISGNILRYTLFKTPLEGEKREEVGLSKVGG